jgi:hypothetical protein
LTKQIKTKPSTRKFLHFFQPDVGSQVVASQLQSLLLSVVFELFKELFELVFPLKDIRLIAFLPIGVLLVI